MHNKSERVKQVAAITDSSESLIWNILSGRRGVSWPFAEALEGATGIPASWWMRASKEELQSTLLNAGTWEHAERRCE